MKRTFLTLLFATYYFFMPFVMVNCSSTDQPYALDADAAVNDDEPNLKECLIMEFLVEPCIEILQAEEERIQLKQSKVAAAAAMVTDFQACEQAEIITAEAHASTFQTDDEEPVETEPDPDDTEDVVDCESVIADMISAYQICDALMAAEKYEDCDEIEQAVEDAVGKCDESLEGVTKDFCNSLTA